MKKNKGGIVNLKRDIIANVRNWYKPRELEKEMKIYLLAEIYVNCLAKKIKKDSASTYNILGKIS